MSKLFRPLWNHDAVCVSNGLAVGPPTASCVDHWCTVGVHWDALGCSHGHGVMITKRYFPVVLCRWGVDVVVACTSQACAQVCMYCQQIPTTWCFKNKFREVFAHQTLNQVSERCSKAC